MQSNYTMDQLVQKYIQLRDASKALKEKHAKELEPIHTAMAALESTFLGHMNDNGMESFATAFGTPYRTVATSVSVEDWDRFFPWALSSGYQGMLTRGANKSAVEAYLNVNKELPPGLKVDRRYVCNVRRKDGT